MIKNYKKECTLIAFIFLLFCVAILGVRYKSYYDINYFNSRIIAKTAEELKTCKDDYYISYISFKDSFFKKELKIIDEIKTIKNAQGHYETVSVKFRNKSWGKRFVVDQKTYNLISKSVANPIYMKDLSNIKDFPLVKKIVAQSHKKPVKAGLVAVKHYFNIVYIFIITNTNKNNMQCSEGEFKNILSNMYNYTKQLNKGLF